METVTTVLFLRNLTNQKYCWHVSLRHTESQLRVVVREIPKNPKVHSHALRFCLRCSEHLAPAGPYNGALQVHQYVWFSSPRARSWALPQSNWEACSWHTTHLIGLKQVAMAVFGFLALLSRSKDHAQNLRCGTAAHGSSSRCAGILSILSHREKTSQKFTIYQDFKRTRQVVRLCSFAWIWTFVRDHSELVAKQGWGFLLHDLAANHGVDAMGATNFITLTWAWPTFSDRIQAEMLCDNILLHVCECVKPPVFVAGGKPQLHRHAMVCTL